MTDIGDLVTTIAHDAALVFDLIQKLKASVATAKDVLKSNPDASMAEQLADAQAKLKSIQEHANEADADFDAALAAIQ